MVHPKALNKIHFLGGRGGGDYLKESSPIVTCPPPWYFILAAGVKFEIAFQIRQKFPCFSLLLTTADTLQCDNFSTPKAKKRAPNGFN